MCSGVLMIRNRSLYRHSKAIHIRIGHSRYRQAGRGRRNDQLHQEARLPRNHEAGTPAKVVSGCPDIGAFDYKLFDQKSAKLPAWPAAAAWAGWSSLPELWAEDI